MALIKCNECGNEISDKSEYCIHCGNPLNNRNTEIKSWYDLSNEEQIKLQNEFNSKTLKKYDIWSWITVFVVIIITSVIVSFIASGLFDMEINGEVFFIIILCTTMMIGICVSVYDNINQNKQFKKWLLTSKRINK